MPQHLIRAPTFPGEPSWPPAPYPGWSCPLAQHVSTTRLLAFCSSPHEVVFLKMTSLSPPNLAWLKLFTYFWRGEGYFPGKFLWPKALLCTEIGPLLTSDLLTWGLENSLLVGGGRSLCIVGYSAAPLASTHWMPAPFCPLPTTEMLLDFAEFSLGIGVVVGLRTMSSENHCTKIQAGPLGDILKVHSLDADSRQCMKSHQKYHIYYHLLNDL